MLLDTTVIIDLLKGNNDVINKLASLEKTNTTMMTTSITVFEVWKGSGEIHDRHKIEKLVLLLESMNILNLDYNSAKEAGIISANLKKEGKEIEPEDCMIAGIAKSNRVKLLTRITKHFERIYGLNIETY